MGFSQETLKLSENEFSILRDLIHDRTGLIYENSKRDVLADKLSQRVILRGFEAFIDYYYLLKYGPGAEEEWRFVLDCLSVQETYFWREMEHIRALVKEVVPQYFSARRARPLRIWSAACATGEEPLTIAMALNEDGWFQRLPIEIIATDGSKRAIEKAREGRFRERAFRTLPISLREKYFRKAGDCWQVVPELHARVQWSTANLLAREEVIRQLPAAVVFCRNVFIYFSGEAITRTVRIFSEFSAGPVFLFVGMSESLLKFKTDFALEEIGGAFVYVKR